MPTTSDREEIRALVREVLAERAQRSRLREVLQRAVDVARSERAVRWAKYGVCIAVGTALHHALVNPCALP